MNNSRTYYTQSNTRFEKKKWNHFFLLNNLHIFILRLFDLNDEIATTFNKSYSFVQCCWHVNLTLPINCRCHVLISLCWNERERETHLTFSLKITSTDAFINCIFTWITHWGLWAFSLHGWAVINAHAAVKWSRGNKRRVRERRRRELRHHTTSNNSWLSAQKSINKILILYDFHIHNRSDSS